MRETDTPVPTSPAPKFFGSSREADDEGTFSAVPLRRQLLSPRANDCRASVVAAGPGSGWTLAEGDLEELTLVRQQSSVVGTRGWRGPDGGAPPGDRSFSREDRAPMKPTRALVIEPLETSPEPRMSPRQAEPYRTTPPEGRGEVSSRASDPVAHPREAGQRAYGTAPWFAHALLGVLLAVYIVWLAVRHSMGSGVWVDGWEVDAFELVVGLLCLARGLGRQPRRSIAVLLGCALLSWCAGDIALTIEALGGRTPPTPSVADLFYLGFYPLAYVAIVLFMQGDLRRLTAWSWLDGAVAGLGAAAACAAFAFHGIVHAIGGSAAAAGIDLAYPVGDLLLLSLVVAGTAVLPGRRSTAWILLAGAFSLNAIGDTFNLLHSSAGATRVGTIFDAIAWPGAFLLMSMAVWLPHRPADPMATPRATGFALPGVAAVGGLAILLAGTLHPLTPVSIGLAAATLVLVGIRLALSVRRLRLLTEHRHRQSMTDELTALGNRRHLACVLDSFFAGEADPLTPPRSLAFLFLDLDRFKEVNDEFGHAAGDQLLRQLGPRLMSSLRGSDVLVRLGGDEFGGVLLGADAEYAHGVAERLVSSLEQPFILDVTSARVGVSIGIAIAPVHASDPATLLRCADAAMYRAKGATHSVETYSLDIDQGAELLRRAGLGMVAPAELRPALP